MEERLLRTYAVRHRDSAVVSKSRSGGIFVAVSDYILQNLKGVVYGSVLDDNLRAVHVRAEDITTRDLMCGSKYVQSELGDIFSSVKKDLQSGRVVLFTGTSCQVMGLKKFLASEVDCSSLYLMDIVCHGVPSPQLYKDYISYQESRQKSKCIAVNFRNKEKYGWRDHVETLRFVDGKEVDSQEYTKLFYSHKIIRPSCFVCPFKSIQHPGDITIADCWGVEKVAPQFDDNKGCSLVLINSMKGNSIFTMVMDSINYTEVNIQECMQPPLKAPFPMPHEYVGFWKDYQHKGIAYVIEKYINNTRRQARVDFVYRVKNKVLKILRLKR